MVHNEGRLDQMLLNELLEEEVQDVALLMTLLELNVLLLSDGACLFQSVDLVEIHAGVLLYRVHHGDACERLSEIHLNAVICNGRGPKYFLCQVTVQVLGQIHHAVIISVSLVELHQSEFRIMTGVDALVTEYTADLVNALQTADDQALQVQLKGDTKLHILIQRIEMRFKGSGSRTAGVLYQHGGLYLHEAQTVQIAANSADDLRTLQESVLNLRVHDQVHITLTIPHIGVRKSVELLRQDLQALREQGQCLHMNGGFACLRDKYIAGHTDDIADVQLLKFLIRLFTERVSGNIQLNVTLEVADVGKGSFTHDTFRHHTSGNRYRFTLIRRYIVLNIGGMIGNVVFGDRKRILSVCLKFRKLLSSYLKKLVNVYIFYIGFLCLLRHSDSLSDYDIHNLVFCNSVVGLIRDRIADLMAQQRTSQRRLVTDHHKAAVRLGRADERKL